MSARAQIKVDHRNGQTPDDNQHVKDWSLIMLGDKIGGVGWARALKKIGVINDRSLTWHKRQVTWDHYSFS